MLEGITYSKIRDENELADHICGEQSIDVMVRESFYPHILKQQNTYCIRYYGEIVGSFAITVRAINVEASDKEIANCFSNTYDYGIIYVKYLAVDHDVQNNGIGTAMLEMIVQKAKVVAEKLPIRCLAFEALRNKVEYYKKRGFEILYESGYEKDSETVWMYFDLMSEEERKILEENYEEY